MPEVRSATLGFFFRVGSRHEPPELHGISHFIEHTVFKGTERRSALDLAIEQDRLGGNFDAFTTHEETGFAIKVIDEMLPAAFDLIADMLISPVFDENDLRAEQSVIIEEMKMIEDSPEELLATCLMRHFFQTIRSDVQSPALRRRSEVLTGKGRKIITSRPLMLQI
jgi:predicted Zn-dependent peptidase